MLFDLYRSATQIRWFSSLCGVWEWKTRSWPLASLLPVYIQNNKQTNGPKTDTQPTQYIQIKWAVWWYWVHCFNTMSATVFLLKTTYFITNNSFWSLGYFIHRSRRNNNKSEHFQALIPEASHRLPAFTLHFLHSNGISIAKIPSDKLLLENSSKRSNRLSGT